MHVIICDDESIFRARLRELLVKESFAKNMDVEVSEYEDGGRLLQDYKDGCAQCDILFLDVRMKDMDGLKTARLLRSEGMEGLIVFLTNLPEYARMGYEVRAFRYLLKDEAEEGLSQVLDACRSELEAERFFNFSWEHRFFSVPKAEILYFESRKRLMLLHTARKNYQFYQKMDVLEKQLSGEGFFRCHRSFLVQERYVRGWQERALWLEDGTVLSVSRSYEKEVNRRLMLNRSI